MDTARVLIDLRAERNRLDRAISALEQLDGAGNLQVTAPKAQPATKQPTKRRLTPAGRKRLSEMMKKRWAARRKAAAQPAREKAGTRKPMSPARRKRLSEMMRARWVQRKRKAVTVKKAAPAHHMSAATKKRLSLLAKRRWAARKKAATAS